MAFLPRPKVLAFVTGLIENFRLHSLSFSQKNACVKYDSQTNFGENDTRYK